jgi:ATP phosphoribosyltransferase regulatory subunit
MAGLLPEGFHDRLPPFADAAARLERAMLDRAHLWGYEQVDPPLVEFEDELAQRLKAGAPRDAVRFVDPLSQKSLAVRPDITAQIGRIAATRMGHHPRPVRLSYAGTVLKLRASELSPERAIRQIGVELIGFDTVAAVREVVEVAVEALTAAGVTDLSIDFTLPDLVQTLGGAHPALSDALDAKDAGRVAAIDAAFLPLIAAAGPFDRAITQLRERDDGRLTSRLDGLEAIAAGLPGHVALTLDPTERHGFEYKSWVAFSIFGGGARGEIGRGGSYTVLHDGGAEERAVGVTLYPDPVLTTQARAVERRRLFVPHGTGSTRAAELRAQGWVTVAALDLTDTPDRQLCTHILTEHGPEPA